MQLYTSSRIKLLILIVLISIAAYDAGIEKATLHLNSIQFAAAVRVKLNHHKRPLPRVLHKFSEEETPYAINAHSIGDTSRKNSRSNKNSKMSMKPLRQAIVEDSALQHYVQNFGEGTDAAFPETAETPKTLESETPETAPETLTESGEEAEAASPESPIVAEETISEPSGQNAENQSEEVQNAEIQSEEVQNAENQSEEVQNAESQSEEVQNVGNKPEDKPFNSPKATSNLENPASEKKGDVAAGVISNLKEAEHGIGVALDAAERKGTQVKQSVREMQAGVNDVKNVGKATENVFKNLKGDVLKAKNNAVSSVKNLAALKKLKDAGNKLFVKPIAQLFAPIPKPKPTPKPTPKPSPKSPTTKKSAVTSGIGSILNPPNYWALAATLLILFFFF